MSHEILDGVDVHPVLGQPGGEGVAQGVEPDLMLLAGDTIIKAAGFDGASEGACGSSKLFIVGASKYKVIRPPSVTKQCRETFRR